MTKAIIISGLLTNLSDNLIKFLDKDTDIYCHTWSTPENKRWVYKLNRYKKYCREIKLKVQEPIFDKKLYSYFYSTYQAINMISNIDQYNYIIKFKPNLESEEIQYMGNLEYYFHKAYIQSYPLLQGVSKEDCLYGPIYYQTMDERMFSGYPLAFKKAFHILEEEFLPAVVELDNYLIRVYGEDYEGSIFWKIWFESRKINLILDLDLKVPNNKN